MCLPCISDPGWSAHGALCFHSSLPLLLCISLSFFSPRQMLAFPTRSNLAVSPSGILRLIPQGPLALSPLVLMVLYSVLTCNPQLTFGAWVLRGSAVPSGQALHVHFSCLTCLLRCSSLMWTSLPMLRHTAHPWSPRTQLKEHEKVLASVLSSPMDLASSL